MGSRSLVSLAHRRKQECVQKLTHHHPRPQGSSGSFRLAAAHGGPSLAAAFGSFAIRSGREALDTLRDQARITLGPSVLPLLHRCVVARSRGRERHTSKQQARRQQEEYSAEHTQTSRQESIVTRITRNNMAARGDRDTQTDREDNTRAPACPREATARTSCCCCSQ